jgi:hypothetical protein
MLKFKFAKLKRISKFSLTLPSPEGRGMYYFLLPPGEGQRMREIRKESSA